MYMQRRRLQLNRCVLIVIDETQKTTHSSIFPTQLAYKSATLFSFLRIYFMQIRGTTVRRPFTYHHARSDPDIFISFRRTFFVNLA